MELLKVDIYIIIFPLHSSLNNFSNAWLSYHHNVQGYSGDKNNLGKCEQVCVLLLLHITFSFCSFLFYFLFESMNYDYVHEGSVFSESLDGNTCLSCTPLKKHPGHHLLQLVAWPYMILPKVVQMTWMIHEHWLNSKKYLDKCVPSVPMVVSVFLYRSILCEPLMKQITYQCELQYSGEVLSLRIMKMLNHGLQLRVGERILVIVCD